MFQIQFAVDPALQNLSNPSWDTFLVLFYLSTAIIYSFFVSRERLAVVLLSVYSALAIVQGTPILSALLSGYQENMFQIRVAAFVVIFLLLYVILSHNMTLHSEIGHRWWQAVVLSFLQVGLLISSILILIPKSVFTSQLSEYFFTSDIARSVWMILPIASMLIMRNKHHGGAGGPQRPF